MGFHYDFYPYYYMSAGVMTAWTIICLAIAAVSVVAMWKLFVKAGEEGWAAIVPFYNMYILFKITWGNGLMFLLLLIPLANIVIMIITWVKFAKAFGKGGGWACGLIFLNTIFLCIMGFSNDIQYIGVNGQSGGYTPGGYQNSYQNPYQNHSGDPYENAYRQQNYQQTTYQQQSSQNPNYHYQRTDAQQAPKEGGFCPECGSPVESVAKFCAKCGKKL